MIDTDKYEGHTNNWKWIYLKAGYDNTDRSGFYLYSLQSIFGNEIIHDTPDGKLAQDAPLLLEEVKQLREKLNAKIALITDVDTMIGDKWNVTQDDWNELVNKHYGDDEE